MKKIAETAKAGSLFLIQAYQHTISPFLGPCCRFTPSCSAYAQLSIQRFGVVEGTGLFLKRLVKCHPFHPGGVDPVPKTSEALHPKGGAFWTRSGEQKRAQRKLI